MPSSTIRFNIALAPDNLRARSVSGTGRAVDAAASLPDDLDEHPLGAVAVELAVEDLLPGAEVELPPGDRHDDLPAHDLALEVGVGVVLAGAVVAVAGRVGVEGG